MFPKMVRTILSATISALGQNHISPYSKKLDPKEITPMQSFSKSEVLSFSLFVKLPHLFFVSIITVISLHFTYMFATFSLSIITMVTLLL